MYNKLKGNCDTGGLLLGSTTYRWTSRSWFAMSSLWSLWTLEKNEK